MPLSTDQNTPHTEEGETVRVVADEPNIRMLVADVLFDLAMPQSKPRTARWGSRFHREAGVSTCWSPTWAFQAARTSRRRAARVLRPGLKVLFITGYAENAVVGSGHLEPGMQVLTKPFNMDDLAGRIRELIEG